MGNFFVFILVYGIALISGLLLAGFSVATLVRPALNFWPPPCAGSWQHVLFRIFFRVFFLSLTLLSVITFGDGNFVIWRYAIGIPLLLVGFGLAIHWTNFLGWRNAFGEAQGLITDGPYRWSRNPIYVVSILGMLGWGLIVASWSVSSLLVMWAFFYVLAPFMEEPWLEHQYGATFTSYKALSLIHISEPTRPY